VKGLVSDTRSELLIIKPARCTNFSYLSLE